MFDDIHREIREAVDRWGKHTKNARDIIRKSGFRPVASEAGIPRPILTIEGSRRICFSPFRVWASDFSQWAVKDTALYAWGTDLGGAYNFPDGTPNQYLTPTLYPQAEVASGVVDVAGSAGNGTLILKDDGTTLYRGQFREDEGELKLLPEISDVIAISHHTTQAPTPSFYFLKSDGTVSHFGTSGAGMSASQSPPAAFQWRGADPTIIEQMPTDKVADVVQIACISSGLVFRTSADVVGIWRRLQANPEYPTGQPAGVAKIHAGLSHPLILTDGGEIWGTGDNTFGQYGDGTTTTSGTPFASWHKANGSGYTDVAGAEQRVLAARGGTLWTWGQGGAKSARGVSAAAASTPQDTGFEAVKVFGNYELQAPMLQKGDGCVMIWGDNQFGWLGRGYTGGSVGTPQILEFAGAYPEWQIV